MAKGPHEKEGRAASDGPGGTPEGHRRDTTPCCVDPENQEVRGRPTKTLVRHKKHPETNSRCRTFVFLSALPQPGLFGLALPAAAGLWKYTLLKPIHAISPGNPRPRSILLLLLRLLGFLDLPWSCSWRVRWLLGAPFAARVLVLVPVLGLVEAPSTERALVLGLWDLPSTKLHLPVAAPRIGAQVHMHRRSRLQKPGLNH